MDHEDPESIRRLVQLFLDHNLVGTQGVIRTMGFWFGFPWREVSDRLVRGVLKRVLNFLSDPAARHDSLASTDPETVYLGLWTMACYDVAEAAGRAADLFDSANVERRFIGAHFLGVLETPRARRYLVEALDDEDLRVALHAVEGCLLDPEEPWNEIGLFERLERLLLRLPSESKKLEPVIWPWHVLVADRHYLVVELG